MAVRKIFEAEQDGRSVIVWEAGSGTRVMYPTEQAAETATNWLILQANRFHEARESNDGSQHDSMVSVVCYGDQPMTEFQFVCTYMDRVRKLGYETEAGLLRPSKEFW